MTSGQRNWAFDADVGADVLHLIGHVARAVDGDVGPIVLVSAQPNRSYLLVGDEREDRRVVVPAGSITTHEPDGAVKLCLTTAHIQAAPSFEPARRNEREYFEMLAAYFDPLLARSRVNASGDVGGRHPTHTRAA